MKIYDDSKTFIVNSEIEAVVADIKSILKKSVPYSEIFKLPELLDTFINLYSKLLNEMQKPIDNAIQEARQRVFEELQDKKCHDKLADKYVNLSEKLVTRQRAVIMWLHCKISKWKQTHSKSVA